MNAFVTRIRTEAEAEIERLYQAHGLPALRESWQVFESAGLPHRRIEAWHYTDLRARLRHVLPLAPVPGGATIERCGTASVLKDIAGVTLVFIDGHFVPSLSSAELPQGVSLNTNVEAAASIALPVEAAGDAMLALNSALLQGAVTITINEGATIEAPIHIVSLASDSSATSLMRVVVHAGAGAKATIVETFVNGAAEAQRHSSIVFDIAESAGILHLVRHIGDGALTTQVASIVATLRAHSKFESYAVVASGALIRRQIFARFDGSDAEMALLGACVLRGEQHADTTLVVDHASAHCTSRERFKHIVDGEATGVFQGKIIVRPGAQKTDGAMKSDTVLLSDSAVMNNKPELEIFADDVVCGHGATCGYLDEDQLFYLMARGLPRDRAEALLLDAFAGEVFDAIEDEALHDLLRSHLHDWLDARGARE